jgi:hypothetical protein
MSEQFKNDLLKFACQKHPVLAILGDPEFNLNYILPELEKISTELQVFEFVNKESFRKLDEFLLLFAKNLKIAVCIFSNLNQNLVSGILKKIEDVPERTCFVLLASYLPETILNRAFLITHSPPREGIDWIEKILDQWDGISELVFAERPKNFGVTLIKEKINEEAIKKDEKNRKLSPAEQSGEWELRDQEGLNSQTEETSNMNENQEKIFKAILVWFEKKLLSMSRHISKLRESEKPDQNAQTNRSLLDNSFYDEASSLSSIHFVENDLKSEFSLGYSLWEKLIEIEFWFDSKQITASSGIEIALSILVVSDLLKKS